MEGFFGKRSFMGGVSLPVIFLHVIVVLLVLGGQILRTNAAEAKVHVVTIMEETDTDLIAIIDEALSEFSSANDDNGGLRIEHNSIIFQEGGEFSAYLQVCEFMSRGISIMLDLTWEGWTHGQNMANTVRLPYVHLDITTQQFVHATDDFLRYRNATDAALVFPTEYDLDQALLYLVGNTVIRIIVLNGLKSNATDNLRQLKPVPSQFVMFGTTEQLNLLVDKVNKSNLLGRDSRWTVVISDFGEITNKLSRVDAFISIIKPSPSMCCSVRGIENRHQNSNGSDECNCGTKRVKELFVRTAFKSVGQVFQKLFTEQKSIIFMTVNCTNSSESISTAPDVGGPRSTFVRILTDVLATMPFISFNNSQMKWNVEMDVHLMNSSGDYLIGGWSVETGFENRAGVVDELIQRFFRVGIMFDVPFVFEKRDAAGQIMKDEYGEPVLQGFCIDLLKKLASEMKFDYRIVIPDDLQFGSKDENGTWNGLIADLVKGDTDMIISSLTITSEREEAIDFVAPYFEQSGISIVMRKAEKTTSLFKFMSVLKEEVWWCILAALVVTALVLWVVDRYSPYSGRNKELYPYKCREFTLTECFWFALTSMTPQGGGEPPKAVSGRILVAAYWIFVVLMLATFTANLAAFLTVERMQSPVNSMEELAKQSKINYSVVNGTSVHEYFKNMALAEEELYRVWKDMTLNSSNDQSKFRVWDYPIKEQYSRILNVITGTGLLSNVDEGFRKVNEDIEKKFAFIHDASIIRYEVYHNCNLTEVGEPFAEQPYAIAVQSGSHLQDEIGKHLLELQKDRYFETLSQKYWNSSLRKDCPNNDDSEGITLASIGGVFIATLVGLVIGMITLAGEIFFYRKKNKSKVVAIKIKPTVAVRENK